MERESNPMEALCRSGCGFYGNPATDGLCSVCFKPARTLASRNDVMASNGTLQEALKKKQQPPASAASPVSATTVFASPPAATVFASPPTPAPVAAAPTVSCHSAARATLATQAALDKLSEEAGSSGNSSSGSPGVDTDAEGDDKDSGKDKKKKNRCNVCRKKVGLTGFECRCGGLFCSVHRYSDKHECSFDYRELGAQEIRRNNPVVVGEKIHKI